MKKILLIEDDPAVRTALQESLAADNYEVLTASDGTQGFQLASTEHVDAILLDLMLPGMNGEDICRGLRQNGNETPILVLSCKADEIDRVVALEIGADDYLTKPFSVRELRARLLALTRRAARTVAATPAHEQHRRLSAIMFTDMVGYSAMTQRNESLALELLEEHRRMLRPLFTKYGGVEIETIGDAFFVEFTSALEAVQCASEIQSTIYQRNLSVPAERQFRIRIGLHLGDVVHDGVEVRGDGVNIAARLEPLAPPGGICISEDVARQVRNKFDRPLVEFDHDQLKNIQLPVQTYRVVLPWEQPANIASVPSGVDAPAGSDAVRRNIPALIAIALLAVVVLLLLL